MKIGLQEIGWEGVDWVGVAQGEGKWGALVITVMNVRK
jgi:hypothetical protein